MSPPPPPPPPRKCTASNVVCVKFIFANDGHVELILKKIFLVSNFEALFKMMQMEKGIGPWGLALNVR